MLRRGYSVGITMGNAKAIDILAEKDGKQYIIQVKAIYKKKNVGWPMMKDKVNEKIFYLFVNLNGDKMTAPEYFIAEWSRPFRGAFASIEWNSDA